MKQPHVSGESIRKTCAEWLSPFELLGRMRNALRSAGSKQLEIVQENLKRHEVRLCRGIRTEQVIPTSVLTRRALPSPRHGLFVEPNPKGKGSPVSVTTLHRTIDEYRSQWERCRDAYAGTDAVKKRATLYLPQLEGVVDGAASRYDGYKSRALFYPVTSRTVAGLAGLVFGKAPTASGVPTLYQPDFSDVTLTGVSLGQFGLYLCQEVLVTGRVGVLVDMPSETVAPGSKPPRPYWVPYCAEAITNWRTEVRAGKRVLTLVVLLEEKEEDSKDDLFEVKVSVQYRVLRLVNGKYTVSTWTEKKGSAGAASTWIESDIRVPLRRGQPLSYIPFVFLGPTGIDQAISHPPLLDLVDVNLSHYRTSADQEHGAHFTALPTPWISGHKLADGETSLAVGSGTAWILSTTGAQAGMLEFSGAGLKALADIKEEKRLLMVTLGARMLETQKKTAEAATTVIMRHAGERSSLSVLSEALGQALSIATSWHLYWSGVEETSAQKSSIKINPDVMDQLTAQDISALVSAWQAGAISHKTVYYNLEWGEWTRPDVTFEEEVVEIEEEAPAPNLNLPPAVVPGAPALPPASADGGTP